MSTLGIATFYRRGRQNYSVVDSYATWSTCDATIGAIADVYPETGSASPHFGTGAFASVVPIFEGLIAYFDYPVPSRKPHTRPVRRLMPQLFRSRGGDDGDRLEKELASLEEQVRTATPGYETQFLNRAGNLCVDAGQSARALQYYGRAIDAYLESGRFSAAEVLCRKVHQIAPHAVRVRCTLAWLALGKGVYENTRVEIEGYVGAAQLSKQEGLATKQLLMMAEVASDLRLREAIAQHLIEFGATEEADHVFGLVFEERNAARPPSVPDQGKLWGKLLRAALMGPKELQERAWTKLEEETDALPSLTKKDP